MPVPARRRFLVLAALAGLGTRAVAQPDGADAGWAALARPGAIVLFRHATAPGVGDPPQFRLGDCGTQRNLSEEGRAEARRLGEQFRRRGIQVGAVLTSQWCRARETAQLAFPGQVREEPAFNSTFGRGGGDERQTARARALLHDWRGPGALVVVSHQVNIQALAGVSTSSGEGIVLRRTADGRLEVAGRVTS
ncbi:histidine phosphatase family protein [Ramlibacter tataouinensis]|uniref:Histidine phosphatase family protein n=1 Tax=Ramlibacter tataouinensis (strain ATCC BAA-407 / DSM 14655 / LMG 21543 / TTB310) TaxID=365046 RepID=F5Y6A6_RAMTT|nr:histidine phosphatase family protein [Ramlibacter tataouinensis]AEG92792.1 conserved hypothetical protein [Ramlibacter tataouinensis TTB310]